MSSQPSTQPPGQPPPRRRSNDYATVGAVFGVAGCVLYSVSFLGMLVGALGILFGGAGLVYGTRHDVGLAAALSGVGFGFLAVALAVFSRGTS